MFKPSRSSRSYIEREPAITRIHVDRCDDIGRVHELLATTMMTIYTKTGAVHP